MIENRDPVSITCLADCKPDCGYVWTDQSGSEVSSNVVLDLVKPDRTKAGIYKCTATNDYGHLNTDFELNVLCKLKLGNRYKWMLLNLHYNMINWWSLKMFTCTLQIYYFKEYTISNRYVANLSI